MEITITVPDGSARVAALMRALAAYNARNEQLAVPQFVQRIVDGALDGLVSSYLKTKIKPLDFLQRFTQQERIAMRAAAQTDASIGDFLAMLDVLGDQALDLTEPFALQGIQAMHAAGVLAAGRGAEILAI